MEYVCFDLETTGLNPLVDRITTIGIKTDKEELVLINEDESKLLTDFWDLLKNKDFVLVGFNSYRFDIPFLYIRSLKHQVNLINLKGKQIDLRLIFTNWNHYAKGKLEDYTEMIDYELKYNNLHGCDAPRLWEEKKYDELKKYVLQDARMTHAVFNRARKVGLI